VCFVQVTRARSLVAGRPSDQSRTSGNKYNLSPDTTSQQTSNWIDWTYRVCTYTETLKSYPQSTLLPAQCGTASSHLQVVWSGRGCLFVDKIASASESKFLLPTACHAKLFMTCIYNHWIFVYEILFVSKGGKSRCSYNLTRGDAHSLCSKCISPCSRRPTFSASHRKLQRELSQ
jgi:hypothetical protein